MKKVNISSINLFNIEKKMAEAWQEICEVQNINIEDREKFIVFQDAYKMGLKEGIKIKKSQQKAILSTV